MLKKLVKDRFMGVGDPWQSIYGFRGAMQGGMAHAKTTFACKELDLSVSFRCPQAIVENAQWRVPHFKWIKEGGYVERLSSLCASDIDDGATILCRNNAPLFTTALRLLALGRGVNVSGSELGPKIVGIMKKFGDETLSRHGVLAAINEWEAIKTAKKSKTAMDMADCMRVFAEHGTDLGQAIRYAEHLFNQSGTIRLMTGHKSKGLEFDTVYILDSWLLSEEEQDLNLRYVMQTRSKDKLYEIDSVNINW
jgi:superfamily I DNA/RNA helicase